MATRKTSALEFSTTWNAAADFDAVCTELGAETKEERRMLAQRASIYRNKKQVPLKQFSNGRNKVDWSAVSEAALSALASDGVATVSKKRRG